MAFDNLKTALTYRRRGWSVIPIDPRGKKPLIEWAEFQERLATEEEIRTWWGRWPNANVGVVTGRISDLVVVDIDANRVADPDAKMNEILAEAPTDMIARTGGGGYHLFYRHPDRGEVKNRANDLTGVDIRGDGGIAVLPPSVHRTGQRYEWINEGEAGSAPLRLLRTPTVRSAEQPEKWISKAMAGVEEGSRNTTCFRLACYKAKKGIPKDIVLAEMLLWNSRNKPPMGEDEVRRTVESAFKTRDQEALRIVESIELVDEVQSSGTRHLRPITLADLLETQELEMDWILDGVLPSGTCGFIAADPKQFKTFLVLAIGIAVSGGVPFAEREVPKPRKVLVILAEDSRQGTARRVRKLLEGMGLSAENLDNRLHFLIRQTFSINDPMHMEELRALIEAEGYEIVFIDPFAEVFSGDENQKLDAEEGLSNVRQIRNRTGASIILTHHLRKSSPAERGRSSAVRLRGSGYLWGWADAIIMLDSSNPHITTVTVTLREAESPPPLHLVRISTESSFEFAAAPMPELVDEDAELRLAMMTLIASNEGCSWRQLREGVGGGKDRLSKVRNELLFEELVVVDKTSAGHRYHLSETGYGAIGVERGGPAAPAASAGSGAAGRSLLGSPASRPAQPADRNPFDDDSGPAPVREVIVDGEEVWEEVLEDLDVVGWYELYCPEELEQLRARSGNGEELKAMLERRREFWYQEWLLEQGVAA